MNGPPTDYHIVQEWMYRQGRCPTDTELWFAFCHMLNSWKDNRRDGMDVLASADLDEMQALVAAMRELC